MQAYDEHIAFQALENQEFIQKKVRGKILERFDELVDILYRIADSDAPDRMDTIRLIFEIAGMNDLDANKQPPERPTFQQINQYFEERL